MKTSSSVPFGLTAFHNMTLIKLNVKLNDEQLTNLRVHLPSVKCITNLGKKHNLVQITAICKYDEVWYVLACIRIAVARTKAASFTRIAQQQQAHIDDYFMDMHADVQLAAYESQSYEG